MDWAPVLGVALPLVVLSAWFFHRQNQRRRIALIRSLDGEHVRLEVYRLRSRGHGTVHNVAGLVAGVERGALLLTRVTGDPETPTAKEWARHGVPLADIVAVHTPDGQRIEWTKSRAATGATSA